MQRSGTNQETVSSPCSQTFGYDLSVTDQWKKSFLDRCAYTPFYCPLVLLCDMDHSSCYAFNQNYSSDETQLLAILAKRLRLDLLTLKILRAIDEILGCTY